MQVRIIRPLKFLLRVLRGFRRNQGLLLSGAIAYYTLLSMVPLSILILIALTQLMDEQQLMQTLSTYMGMVTPSYASTLIEQVRVFLEHRKQIGIIGLPIVVFFSSLAFSVLENAISLIFSTRERIQQRNFLVSVIIPYVYIILMGIGIVLVTFIIEAIETLESNHLEILGWKLTLGGATGQALYILGITGEVLLLTSFYLVMPVVRVRFRHALIGGISVALWWEITRRVLIWYYSTISMVNVIYGSIAITVMALLSIESVAVILLLGAQVVAELERMSDDKQASSQTAS